VPIKPRQQHTARLLERRRIAHLEVVDDVVFVEPDNHEIRIEPRPEFEQLREFLAGVVARHSEIPDLPVDLRPPRFQALFEQERVRMFVDRTVAERHRIAQHHDADGVRRLRELILAIVAKPEVVDPDRYAGEPSVITGRELLHANRMGDEKSGRAFGFVPARTRPDLDSDRHHQTSEDEGRNGDREKFSPAGHRATSSS